MFTQGKPQEGNLQRVTKKTIKLSKVTLDQG